MRHYSILLAALLATSLFSCKKDTDTLAPETPVAPPATDKMKDSVALIARDLYLWYDQIPAGFDPQSYDDPNEIMTALRQYSTEPGFTGPVDRWSFAMDQAAWDDISSGISGDFGLGVFFRQATDLRVKHVEAASPAGRAGIRRGWRIKAINGNTGISSSNTDFVVETVFNSSSTKFTFEKPDGSTSDITLNAATYREQPVVLDTVYSVGGKKAGYFVFNSFLGDTTQIYNEFNRVFNRFAGAGVTDLIVDLRYNGGGYVSVQSKLANYLVPASGNGGLMMRQQFNNRYSEFNEDENFRKLGNLNVNRIFFIVSKSTASASELLINNLQPYVDIQVVGPASTYGKPVGYFPIPVGNWYIFPVSFRTVNKSGQGNYFGGIPVNGQAADGLDKDWGDVTESSLASALSYISSGSFRTVIAARGAQQRSEVIPGNATLEERTFKGAVDTRARFR
ncbi:MAG TPA: S41 family peptidase [Chitinophagaceae bacterium]|jgi:C-terminal processing protease CtpA/Prc|nr:S41 family peptidase [Chitinophagaceae bacterium]